VKKTRTLIFKERARSFSSGTFREVRSWEDLIGAKGFLRFAISYLFVGQKAFATEVHRAINAKLRHIVDEAKVAQFAKKR
jgi:hypothetical protein